MPQRWMLSVSQSVSPSVSQSAARRGWRAGRQVAGRLAGVAAERVDARASAPAQAAAAEPRTMLLMMMYGGQRGGRGGIAEGGRTRPAIECAATLKQEARGGHATSGVESLAVAEGNRTLFSACLRRGRAASSQIADSQTHTTTSAYNTHTYIGHLSIGIFRHFFMRSADRESDILHFERFSRFKVNLSCRRESRASRLLPGFDEMFYYVVVLVLPTAYSRQPLPQRATTNNNSQCARASRKSTKHARREK